MAMTQPVNGTAPAEVLSLVYQHRLLSTRQIHLLYRPDGSRRSAQRVMKGLRAAGLAEFGRSRSAVTDESVWYVTTRARRWPSRQPKGGLVATR